jgi:tRNA(Ile)-lysidine synthase
MDKEKVDLNSREISIEKGRYIVAVSGGVDSMVLLHMLLEKPGLELVVAHIDHGIRQASSEDRKLVQAYAENKGLEFYYTEAYLGADASEETARDARYSFLNQLKAEHQALAIILAHHQDDVLETAILNLIRGTGRSGLSSLKNQGVLIRPLLDFKKSQIIEYANLHNVAWVEDETNKRTNYLRNYIRHIIVPLLDEPAKQKLLGLISQAGNLNSEIDSILLDLVELLTGENDSLQRSDFVSLNHAVAKEFLRTWLNRRGVKDLSSRNLEDLTVSAKTLKNGKLIDVDAKFSLKIQDNNIILIEKS